MADSRLARVHEHLEKLKKNSIRILSTECNEDQIPVGKSKRHGRPDLPTNMTWPVVCFADQTWTQTPGLTLDQLRVELDDDLNPLAFVAQIRLSEIHELDHELLLPAIGMLYFFEFGPGFGADFDDLREIRVLFSPFESDLIRADWPEEIDPDLQLETSMSLEFSNEWQLPGAFSYFVDNDQKKIKDLEFTEIEFDVYRDGEWTRRNGQTDHLFGFADFSQEQTLERSYKYSFLPFVKSEKLDSEYTESTENHLERIVLLFQMDLGVHHRFYFIHANDLKALRFERTWSTME
jgi:uncharacterized protein YwqG